MQVAITVGHGPSTPQVMHWGGFGGTQTLADPVSGLGSGHNAYMYDHAQKSVLWTPFISGLHPMPIHICVSSRNTCDRFCRLPFEWVMLGASFAASRRAEGVAMLASATATPRWSSSSNQCIRMLAAATDGTALQTFCVVGVEHRKNLCWVVDQRASGNMANPVSCFVLMRKHQHRLTGSIFTGRGFECLQRVLDCGFDTL